MKVALGLASICMMFFGLLMTLFITIPILILIFGLIGA